MAELRPCAPQPVVFLQFHVIPLHLCTMEILPSSMYNKDVTHFLEYVIETIDRNGSQAQIISAISVFIR